jgi:SagB-type dehydrogenase family enzyme
LKNNKILSKKSSLDKSAELAFNAGGVLALADYYYQRQLLKKLKGWNPCDRSFFLGTHRRYFSPAPLPRFGSKLKNIKLPSPPNLPVRLDELFKRRRSQRGYSPHPISLDALSSLLYWGVNTLPPLPGGLKVFNVHLIWGGEPKLYTYHPRGHFLKQINVNSVYIQSVLKHAQDSLHQKSPPPTLLVITFNYKKLSQKYPELAYSLALKTAGVWMQNFHLTAVGLNLKSCLIGNENPWLWKDVSGRSILEQTPIGTVALGQ